MTRTTLVALFCLVLLPAGLKAAEPARTISVTYDFPPPTVANAGDRPSITVPGCETLNRPGEPLLPFRTARLLLPPGTRVVEIKTALPAPVQRLAGTTRQETGPELAHPGLWHAPAAPADRDRPAATPSAPHQTPSWRQAELQSLQRLRGYTLAVVRVFPVQPLPLTGEMLFAPAVQVTLVLGPLVAERPAAARLRDPAATRERLAALLDNPALLAEYDTALAAVGPSADTPRYDYLLVTTDALLPAFQPLLEQKRRNGLAVKAETIASITASQPGRDRPEKIRNYIRTAQADWGVEYVLLGGDTTAVPCRYAYVPMREREANSLLPCDLYYACLDGSWNRDDDQYWGEPTDGEGGGEVDLLAEVWVGRAPVDTPAEVAHFVTKTRRYETQGHSRPASVLVVAEYLGRFSPGIEAQGGRMFDPLLPYLKELAVTWLDDRPHTEPQWTGADAVAALNRGPHFALYNGHGEADTMMRLRAPDLAGLTQPEPFLLCSVGCHTGHFDNDRFAPDSIAEELVKGQPQGAFAAIVNPRFGWFDPRQEWRYSGEFQLRFFARLLQRGEARLGPLCQTARHDLLGQVERTGAMPYRWCYYQVTLLGDPHLALRLPPLP